MMVTEAQAHSATAHTKNARERLERESAQHKADIAAKAAHRIENQSVRAATLNASFGTALLGEGADELAQQFESSQLAAESWVENFYSTKSGRRFLAAHLNYGADGDGAGALRRITVGAAAVYDRFFAAGGVGETHDDSGVAGDAIAWPWPAGLEIKPVAVATSRPGHRWPIRSPQTLYRVADIVKADVYCDFDFFARSEMGSCIDRHVEILGKMHTYDGTKGELRSRYFEQHFFTLPFANGDMVIFARICSMCWGAFLHKKYIDTAKCETIESWSDGFGSVDGSGPVTPNEYLWPFRLTDTD